MNPIFKKEINSFFGSPIAYLVISTFLIVNGLFLWVFKGDFNLFNRGFANLNAFFYLISWAFLFLIPAITMKSFSNEISSGTIEILKTRPLTNWQIVVGKFWASFVLITITLIPTITYVYSISELGNPIGNLDIGSTLGSYIGTLFLAASYTSIGLFTSAISKSQIMAFILGAIITFFLFYGFDMISNSFTNQNYTIKLLGAYEHFKSISRGVIDTRDLVYFVSVTFLFLYLTKKQLTN